MSFCHPLCRQENREEAKLIALELFVAHSYLETCYYKTRNTQGTLTNLNPLFLSIQSIFTLQLPDISNKANKLDLQCFVYAKCQCIHRQLGHLIFA